MSASASLHWIRLDLRLADNAALQAAVRRGGAVIPVFIHAPAEEAPWQPGAASRCWLHQSLSALHGDLRAKGSRLVIREGPSLEALGEIAAETGAGAVFWNRRYEPAVIRRDAAVMEALRARGLQADSFGGALLNEPWTIRNQGGKPFQLFTPFWRHCLAGPAPAEPLPAPRAIPAPGKWPKSLPLEALGLESGARLAEGIRSCWRPGATGARKRLRRFLDGALANYARDRDRPGRPGTSRLSPHVHFGEITPRQIWHAVRRRAGAQRIPEEAWRSSRFLTEVGWREFAHHLLYHFPRTPNEPLRSGFGRFLWRKNKAFLNAWQQGRTGYPLVDAGMRELWATGWMHNRVRMIAASFLAKDLLLSWTEGAGWFWDTLVDADLAQNTLGWQWTAGCGADAAPYFRVFNPTSQGEKLDPSGDYVRRWCPELARLPDRWLHQPWKAPPGILANAGLSIGRDYPGPLVNHAIAREVALEAFARIKLAAP